MKDMSYRDKMVILIISVIIIMIAGFFALIKPAYQKFVNDTATYESTKIEWDGIKQKIDAIPGLKNTITTAYNDAKKDAAVLKNTAFGNVDNEYDIKKVNYGLDQYLQQAIDDNSLEVQSVAISDATSKVIEYNVYTPNVVTYALLENGDLNGNYAADITKMLEESSVLKQRTSASILASAVDLSLKGKREDLMNFLDTMKDDTNAIYISGLAISDYTFSGGTSKIVTDEEGNTTEVADPNADGFSELALTIEYCNAKELDKPDLGK